MSGSPQASAFPIWLVISVYIAMTAIVLYPIMSVSVPALVDYPNHLARTYLESHIGSSDALRRFYEVRWQPVPYLGMDASMVVLNRIAPIYEAGKIFISLCVVLPVVSVAVLHFAAYRRLSLVPAAAFLLSYNYLLYYGFLPYLATLCLAMIVLAGWVATSNWPRWPRALAFCVPALVLYFGHLVAFGAYCLMVAGFEVSRAWRAGFRPGRVVAANWIAAALTAAPAVAFALAIKMDNPFFGPPRTHLGSLSSKLSALLSPMLFAERRVDAAIGFAAFLALFAGWWTGRIKLSSAVWPSFLAVFIFSLFVPTEIRNVWGMDFRLPLLAAMLLLAAVSATERAENAVKFGVLVAILLAVCLRSILIAGHLQELDRTIASIRQVISAMPPGSRLLPVDGSDPGRPPERAGFQVVQHAPVLALIDRDAFVPTLFIGINPAKIAPDYEPSSAMSGSAKPPTLAELIDGLGRGDDPLQVLYTSEGERVYWLGWEKKFDYLLVEHEKNRHPSLPWKLPLIASGEVADLYAIQPLRDARGLR